MKTHIAFSGLIFLLVLVATATGIFYRTPGAPIEYVTVRGEHAVAQGGGLYRYDPAWFAREGVVWDVINLFIGLPMLAAAIVLSLRNSLRGRLLLGGLLFYFFYVYLSAMVGYAFNRLFLIYTAVIALSAVAFVTNLAGIDVTRLPQRVSVRFPRRLFIGFAFVLSAMLAFLWLARIIPIMITDRFPPDLAGVNTLISQGLDLGLVVPLMLSTGILLLRRSPWGYLLASVSLTFGLLMSITIPAWIAVPLFQDGRINLIEATPFLGVSFVGIVLAVMFYSSVQEGRVV